MFADIEGYTSLFQQNEANALRLSELHRADLVRVISAHAGQLVQSYGDGSLSTFDSVVDAVDCAIELQTASRAHAIPLRIGIHVGDLVYRDTDIFGDAVNIAARIQAQGVAGSILVSHKVAAELQNHPRIRLHALGAFRLKNVREPVVLHAVEGNDLVIPPHQTPAGRATRSLLRQYPWLFGLLLVIPALVWSVRYLRKAPVDWSREPIMVAPFRNYLPDTTLRHLPEYLSMALTNELRNSVLANIQDERTNMLVAGGDLNRFLDPDFALRNGCRYTLNGSISPYGLSQDSVVIQSMITDCKSRSIVEPRIRDVVMARSDLTSQAGKAMIINVLKGVWESRDTLPGLSAPLYSAYEDYIQALRELGQGNEAAPLPYLRSAIEKDTTFLEAYLLLLDVFYNEDAPASARDTLDLVRRRFPAPSDLQAKYLDYYAADIGGDRKTAWAKFQPLLDANPGNLLYTTDGIVMALEYANDPAAALSIYRTIRAPDKSLADCGYCRTYMVNAIRAYTESGQAEKAAPLYERVSHYIQRDGELAILAYYLLAVNQPEELERLITQLVAKAPVASQEASRAYYMFRAAVAAHLLDQPGIKSKFLGMALSGYRAIPYAGQIGACLALSGQPSEACVQFRLEIDKTDPTDTLRKERFLGELGVALTNAGDIDSAREVLGELETLRGYRFDQGFNAYQSGRILANLGDHDRAMAMLDQSLDAGIRYQCGFTFQHDPWLAPFLSRPEYQPLLRYRQ